MIPWELLDTAKVPGDGGELRLYRRGNELSIRADGLELMNSRAHGSEEALADLALDRFVGVRRPRVLIGGLGMGFTLAAALRRLGREGRVVVAELTPEVVKWNRGPLADLAGRPLLDERVTVREVDVGLVMKQARSEFDAILLDVDNGPEGLTRVGNDWLYTRNGLGAAFTALRPEGVLAVWSAGPDKRFARRLHSAGFSVEEVQGRGTRNSGRYMIWLAERGL